jgi:hypothetical protein
VLDALVGSVRRRAAGLWPEAAGDPGRERFSAQRWEAAYRRRVARAFAEVPYYREQWAAAGRVLAEPVPTDAGDLETELYRLCALRRPWQPAGEPSLWIGRPGALREALLLAGVADVRLPVLEVRRELVDWSRLGSGPWAPPYAALLEPQADTGAPARRPALLLPAAALAAGAGEALVVGSPAEVTALAAELDRLLAGLQVLLRPVTRVAPADAGRAVAGPLVVHDRYLGYLGARVPGCGAVHLAWWRYHVRGAGPGLTVTALRQSRPTLAGVRPERAGRARVGRCPVHGTPTLEVPPAGAGAPAAGAPAQRPTTV